jgi:hypothetical protein
MARNSAKNSAKFARELRAWQMACGPSGPTASGNLVVDRTEIGFAQDHRHLANAPIQNSSHPYPIRAQKHRAGPAKSRLNGWMHESMPREMLTSR